MQIGYINVEDDTGEWRAFFSICQGTCTYIAGWFANDATYRDEYMRSLIEGLGHTIIKITEDSGNIFDKMKGIAMNELGI